MAQDGPALYHAAVSGDLRQLRHLLNRPNIGSALDHIHGEAGWTPLMGAASKGHADAVKMLVASGANVQTVTSRGATALSIACQSGDAATVEALIAAGSDINRERGDGTSPLILSAHMGHLAVVQALVRGGADISKERSDDSVNAMAAAGLVNQMDVCQYLAENGAEVPKKWKAAVKKIVGSAALKSLDKVADAAKKAVAAKAALAAATGKTLAPAPTAMPAVLVAPRPAEKEVRPLSPERAADKPGDKQLRFAGEIERPGERQVRFVEEPPVAPSTGAPAAGGLTIAALAQHEKSHEKPVKSAFSAAWLAQQSQATGANGSPQGPQGVQFSPALPASQQGGSQVVTSEQRLNAVPKGTLPQGLSAPSLPAPLPPAGLPPALSGPQTPLQIDEEARRRAAAQAWAVLEAETKRAVAAGTAGAAMPPSPLRKLSQDAVPQPQPPAAMLPAPAVVSLQPGFSMPPAPMAAPPVFQDVACDISGGSTGSDDRSIGEMVANAGHTPPPGAVPHMPAVPLMPPPVMGQTAAAEMPPAVPQVAWEAPPRAAIVVGRPLIDLTFEDVLEQLNRLQLTEYIPAFERSAADGEVLASLSEEDLQREFGMEVFGHRRKLMLFIKANKAV